MGPFYYSALIAIGLQVRAAEPEKPVILLPGAPQKPGKPFDLYFQVRIILFCNLFLLFTTLLKLVSVM